MPLQGDIYKFMNARVTTRPVDAYGISWMCCH